MEISGGNYNNPVNFYTKNTENMINTVIDKDNRLYGENVFASEFKSENTTKPIKKSTKKHKRNKRLNTYDTDYLPDEIDEEIQKEEGNNFFVEKGNNKISENMKKAAEYFFTSIPLVNYFYLRQKKKKIENTIQKLNNINQNIDDLMNSAIPFGESTSMYTDIAKNLTEAANIIGKANKNR